VKYEFSEIPEGQRVPARGLADLESNDSRRVGESHGRIVLTVSDTGPGLSLEQQRSLFGEGVQFNPNELQAGQGSGLGLWISKEIVDLHDGQITVRSEGLGCGSTFEVLLPIHFIDDTHASYGSNRILSTPTHRLKNCPPQPSSLPPSPERHLLVVDDAASNRKILCRLLRSKGFICHEAENGQECVDKVLAGEHPYEIILLDYEMPVMDGPTAARRLREEKCDLLIIGVTGNVLPEDKELFIRHGANVVLCKPLKTDELFQFISEHHQTHDV
jgi:two-component system, sensor histidine kinase